MEIKTIAIENLQELIAKMKTMEFAVEWTISPEFGPDGIGSVRKIWLFLDDLALVDNHFCQDLKNKLIEGIGIPERSEYHYINGEGDITLVDNQLIVSYHWLGAKPYQYSDISQNGETIIPL